MRAFIEIAGNYAANVRRLELNKNVMRIGRAPELDVVFAAGSIFVSRQHAEITRTAQGYVLTDLDSFNGTLLNRHRITGPSLLHNGDVIQLGIRGPVLSFRQEGLTLAPPKPLHHDDLRDDTPDGRHNSSPALTSADINRYEPLYVLPFDGRTTYRIGRAAGSYVKLDGLQISQRHATLTVFGKRIFIEDNRSTNGSFVNGFRLMGKMEVGPHHVIQVGPFFLRVDLRRGIEVFDTRAQMRLDCIGLTKVADASPDAPRLLDDLSLTIRPNEFVGLLGPSGAGKTTFMKALNGAAPATAGRVLVNNLDLYQHLNWLRQSIGYVPQDDIIHQELTVYRTLYYVARLRLSRDVSEQEVDSIINEVLDVTGLTEQRNLHVSQLSGGQRKRVSVAVELLTKPSILFLDEPTSGLDPASEERIMQLFRRIAYSGRTVVLTTHSMANVKLFDKIVILMQGKLVFYGTPAEALTYVKATSFKELYDRLEEHVDRRIRNLPSLSVNATVEQQRRRKLRMAQVREHVAEMWKKRFQQTTQYEQNVRLPQDNAPQTKSTPQAHRPTIRNSFAQWSILCRRYSEILKRDKINLTILFVQGPVIAILTRLAVGEHSPRDFLYFILALVPIWFGTSIAAREIIRERAVYRRERMVNLGVLPYIGSKLAVLSLIVSLQCLLLFGTLKSFALFGLKLPTLFGGAPQVFIMILTGLVGVALGLLVSASVKTSELATSFVPLLLIPQILLCGLTGVPKGLMRDVGVLMPATWSFDLMKRFSATEVNVLRGKDEGAMPAYNNEGRGLFKQIEYLNRRALEDKEKELNDYKARQEEKVKKLVQDMEAAKKGAPKNARQRPQSVDVKLDLPPPKATVSYVPDNLSNYVDFLHPWGADWLNPVILFVMFLTLVVVTAAILLYGRW